MPKIKCASIDCEYNGRNNACNYKGQILLFDCYYLTVNEGRQHFWRCKRYKESEQSQSIKKYFEPYKENYRMDGEEE